MSPGPDFLIVLRNSVVSGRRAGVASAGGIAVGVFVWALITAVGVAGLLAASAKAYTVVKLVGAIYLAYIGIRALLAARRGDYRPDPEAAVNGRGTLVALRQGLLTNLLNPKCAVFFIALVPQFLPADPSALGTLELAVVCTAANLCWFVTLAFGVGALRQWFTRRRVRRILDAAMGTFMVGLGLRIAMESN
ncbi:LysE family translocator [Nocardia seriolae]|nr:LysE family translocator [Nocardia seriolae]MTJ73405.1 LysE family translocator [Nocardia seriolae]MTJ87880.1 LysE family translocator [Nocardia seriolae]MTK31872.1 LysE family translocator [Nocardia seriolae]MTK40781.1 LysE family translocator [Nocardia seriolae]